MKTWREHCARSQDGRHHWTRFEFTHVLRKNYVSKPSHIEFFVLCRHCLFRTKAELDMKNKEVRIKK
jgi:hypothetical protein